MGRVDPPSLSGSSDGSSVLSLQVPPAWSGRFGEAYKGDLRDACALRVPSRACFVTPRGARYQLEEGPSNISRVRLAIAG